MKKLLIAGAMLLSFTGLMAQAPANKQSKPKSGGTSTTQPKGQAQGGQGQGKGSVQGQRSNWTPEQKADTVAKRMTKQLNLTADQATQVRAITLTRVNAIDAAKTKYASNPQEKAKQCHAIREKWEQDLHGILTPDQWSTFQAKKQQREEKIKQKRAQNQNANTNKTPEQIQDEIEEEMEQPE